MPVVIIHPWVGVRLAVAMVQSSGGSRPQLTQTATVVPLALTATCATSGVSRENVVAEAHPCCAAAGVARDHSDAQIAIAPVKRCRA